MQLSTRGGTLDTGSRHMQTEKLFLMEHRRTRPTPTGCHGLFLRPVNKKPWQSCVC